jgi:cardiolipin synthase
MPDDGTSVTTGPPLFGALARNRSRRPSRRYAAEATTSPTRGENTSAPLEDPLVRVITNRLGDHPSRSIRGAYLKAMREATTSIDIASAYFLPSVRFLHAMRNAARRGVQVRLLVPAHSDVWIVWLAMSSLYGRLLADGVEVYAYAPRILHSKTAIFDARYTMIGSHNLDAQSWRFNLECNVLIDSPEFARTVGESFVRDLAEADPVDLAQWRTRPRIIRFLGWFAALFRTFL